MQRYLLIISIFVCSFSYAQQDSTECKKLQLTGDFRFRIEQDWNGINQQGLDIKDRSRLRYRFRFGLHYALDKYSSFGGRLRSGNINDQQGPHVTIGGGNGEFELVKVGLEKLYYQFDYRNLSGWVGKNDIPLVKLNELFWNDNVFSEGIGLQYQITGDQAPVFQNFEINTGHFIIRSNNGSFSEDSYLQVLQLSADFLEQRIRIFPGFYAFRNVGNFPDRKSTFFMDYSIFHLGAQIALDKKKVWMLGLEYYHNLANYQTQDSVAYAMQNERTGLVFSATYGQLKAKGDWLLSLTYAHIEKYAVVDYFAQNDWARWDYSSIGASGARLSNFQGVEIKVGYAVRENFDLNIRTYFVDQLVLLGANKERGNRIRLDLNIGF